MMRVLSSLILCALLLAETVHGQQALYFSPGSSVIASTGVSAGTFGDGNFSFRDMITIGTDGTSNTIAAAGVPTPPANGWIIAPNPNWGFGANPTDIAIMNSLGFGMTVRSTSNYTMLMASNETRSFYLSSPSVVFFNAAGRKIHTHSSYNQGDTFVLGEDSFSLGSADDLETLQAFDGDRTGGATNQHGGILRLGGGQPTGTGAAGWITFYTAPNGTGVSGNTIIPYTEKAKITDGFVLVDAGTKPTCNSTNRGMFWYDAGAGGVKDTAEVCAKDAADAYAWRVIY